MVPQKAPEKTEGRAREELGGMGRFLTEAKAKEAKSWPRAREEGRKRYSSPERNNEDRSTCKQLMPGGVLELRPLPTPRCFPIQPLCLRSPWAHSFPCKLFTSEKFRRKTEAGKRSTCLPCGYSKPFSFGSLGGESEVVFVRSVFSRPWPCRSSKHQPGFVRATRLGLPPSSSHSPAH